MVRLSWDLNMIEQIGHIEKHEGKFLRYTLKGWKITTQDLGSIDNRTLAIEYPEGTLCGYSYGELMILRNTTRHPPKTIKVIS